MGLIKHAAGETILWERTTSGMRCCFYPKRQYGEQMAAVVVPYGATGMYWRKDGTDRPETFPMGAAHFIEHKLFQQPWGDAFAAFSENGASANAFTDGRRTVYYFTCRTQFLEHLRRLLEFVQTPYFMREDVEKEKGIITSEIALYEDRPDWAAYQQMMEMMYQNHPIRFPVAGTVESVEKTTAEQLRRIYDVCYLPQTFLLICCGDVEPRKVMELAERVPRREKIGELVYPRESTQIQERYRERILSLRQPIFHIGFKLCPQQIQLREKAAMELLLELWAGESSAFFEEAYEKELLDEPLSSMFEHGESYAFCAFSGGGSHGEETAELLVQAWNTLRRQGIERKAFERVQKKKIGQTLRLFQSVTATGMAQMDLAQYEADLSDWFRSVKELQKQDVEKWLQNTRMEDKMVLSVIR